MQVGPAAGFGRPDLGRISLPVLGPGRPGYDRQISDYVVKNLMPPVAVAAR
jgi:hypothetical protein